MSEQERVILVPGAEVALDTEFNAAKPYILSGMKSVAEWGRKAGILKDSTLYLAEFPTAEYLQIISTEQFDPSVIQPRPLRVAVIGGYAKQEKNAVVAATRVDLRAPDYTNKLTVNVVGERPVAKFGDVQMSHIQFMFQDPYQTINYVLDMKHGQGQLNYTFPGIPDQISMIEDGKLRGIWPESLPNELRPILLHFSLNLAKKLMVGMIAAGTPMAEDPQTHARRLANLFRSVTPEVK